jgi:hypothetical protein
MNNKVIQMNCGVFDVRLFTMFKFLMIFLMSLACLEAGAVGPADRVRVYAIEPACFDYVFTAIVSPSTNPVLSFNHRGGRTFFVRRGDRLGGYVVGDFQPLTNTVFNPALNAHQERKAGRVTLNATNEPPLVLELGQRLPQPGWMAYLVDLTDGNWWTVREDDVVHSDMLSFRVGPVGSNSVSLYLAGRTNAVPLIADTEATQLATLWASRARQQAAGKRDAEPEPEDSIFDNVAAVPVQQAAPRRTVDTVVMRYPSRTFFGTDYSCPTEFRVLPGIWSSSGQLIRPTVVLPRRFETRSSGISIEYRSESR